MLRFKITPPRLPPLVDRPRLLHTVLPAPVVVLAAPAGHGKTCLAAQIAAATDGPTAWFVADELDRDRAGVGAGLLAALTAAWPELDSALSGLPDEAAAVPLLGDALETLAGPGCLVLDDAHQLPHDVLDTVVRTTIAALPPGLRLVLCTRGAVPEAVLRVETMGQAVMLGPTDLAFDVDECRGVSPLSQDSTALHARTGGWPLAVALSSHGHITTGLDAVADVAVTDLDRDARELLVVLARLPRFPARLATRLGQRYAALTPFARRNPLLFTNDDDWWSPREWLRDALRERGADGRLVETVARALHDLDQDELAAHLLVAETRYEDAVPLTEQLATDGMNQGRAAWVHALIAPIPPPMRTFSLVLLAARAADALDIVGATGDATSAPDLTDLVERAAAQGPGAQLWARRLLANHYRMTGDARLLTVCERALGDALTATEPASLASRWPPSDLPAAADMLRFYGSALLLAPDPQTVQRGQRLVAIALDLLDNAGRPTLSVRAWSTYIQVLLYLTRPADALASLRHAAHRLAQLDHSEAALRLAELATTEFLADDRPATRQTIEIARECAHRTGNQIALAPLAAIELALDVLDHSLATEHDRRLATTLAQLAANPRLAPFTPLVTAEFGIVLVRSGQLDAARRYLDQTEQLPGTSLFAPTTAFRYRRLRGLLQLAEGSTDQGQATLDALKRDAAAQGRVALVDLIQADMAGPHPARDTPHRHRAPPPLTIRVMAPELTLTIDGRPAPTPRGYPAKLLALLITADGTMTLDAAIERLWPGADPDTGRNRLHGVILRLRRSMGLPADGPISCTEGLVRLERFAQLQVDSWEFERLAAHADARPDTRPEALAAYHGDVLTAQFAYDDTIANYRAILRSTFLHHATALLTNPPDTIAPETLATLAQRAYRLAPDDTSVRNVATRTLSRLGQHTSPSEPSTH